MRKDSPTVMESENLVKVVRAKSAEELAMARQVSAVGAASLDELLATAKVTIDGADLIELREALRSAGRAYRRIYDSILNGLPVGRTGRLVPPKVQGQLIALICSTASASLIGSSLCSPT